MEINSLGLGPRQEGTEDRRVRAAIVTPKGKAMTDAVDAARERIGRQIFATWDEQDFSELVRLLQRLAADIESSA